MKVSTIWAKRWFRIGVTALFWLAVWQAAAVLLPKLLFAGPVPTVRSLLSLLRNSEFWFSIAHSLGKIASGFLLAFSTGCLLAIACRRMPVLRMLLGPLIQVMKSLPVACFIVVALIWVRSEWISVLTAFFVVFPAVYINLGEGLQQTDQGMLEMAQLFHLTPAKRLRAVWLPACLPYLLSACRVSVGMALKAGVAGEIIGLPRWSIGEQLYLSKLYLNTADLFAWSLVIILLSLALERLLVFALATVQRKWGIAA
ncbi:ABC transporter permease subunit [Agathobaculum sp. NSJ-28]|uniref:ABC transporter permease subunit n=2 Tax=Agathobaculum TaxID=2048137 RepID=A0A923LTH3_9FIRM|nr:MULTISPECIES: ABC transporter permease subunit [Butyricicoccaceae]MBC5724146.1 ABC transporter permease subunit [Agathobaculum faecis]MCU6787778.1 ABC transporter permease subunit [Agathobaculum ammoniilyticum]WOC76824.1 ABC transporter permease subunit [Intestinibacillus sp. NTUH-41-i26]SCI45409.1 Bicarbonate transport system permease protein CmpB [uncultured Butyricicoccus sp.]